MEPNQTLALRPRAAQNLFLLGWLSLLVLLGSFYFYASYKAEVAFERNLIHGAATEAIILDDHIDRALTSVFSKLVSVQTLSEILPGSPAHIDPAEITKFIDDDRSVRSLSLIDDRGTVLTSSNPENIGLTLSETLFGLSVTEAAASKMPTPQLGVVLPYRDLSDLVTRQASKTQKLMLASLAFKKNDVSLLWVATINLGLFENLWQRISHHDDTEIVLFDARGKALLSHHPQEIDRALLGTELLQRIENKQIGHFYTGKNNQFLVVYRTSSQQPQIFATISNLEILSAPLQEEKKELSQLALGLMLFFSILFWWVYRWYRRYEKAVTYSSNLFRGITAHVMMTRTDLEGRIQEANAPFLNMTGYSLEEVIGQNHRIFNSGMQSAAFYEVLWETIARGDIWKGTFRNQTKSGQLVWVNATIIPDRDQWGKVRHYTALFSDITNAIELSERFERELKQRESLERMNNALHSDLNLDHLTQVASRRALDEFLEHIQHQDDLVEAPLSVLMMDLDHFKRVNDTWGHQVGDEVLKTLTRRWSALIRASDMLARLGGEEFIAVLVRTTAKNATLVAEKIRAATESEFVVVVREGEALNVPITVSIGIATVGQLKGFDLKLLYRAADEALYEAKHSGRNCIRHRML